LGLFGLTLERWRSFLSARWPQLRQALILAAGAIGLYAAFLRVDLDHRTKAPGFFVNAGRYIIPAYPAMACLLVLGLLSLVRERVGLNLVFLVPGETGGREPYARELVGALRADRPDLELVAFVNRETAAAGDGFWGEAVTLPVHARRRAEWALGEQVALPRAA